MENVKDTNNISDKSLEENNDEYIKKSNKGQTFQDKLVKLYIEKETKKYKYNIVDLPENLKYSSDNSEGSTSQRTKKNKNKDNNGYTHIKKDKKDINNDNNRNDEDDKNSQKEVIIKDKDKDNEKKNPKIINIINSLNNEKDFSFRNKKPFLNEVKNRTYSMDDNFGFKTDKNINKISKTKFEEKTKEYEEEKNRKLYKLLLLKNLSISTKRYDRIESNEESNNKREKSSTNRISSSKEKEAKDGALKIMELIKAKKTEKNVIDKIEKEAQEAFKRAKTPLNKNVEYSPTFLTKDKGSLFNTSDKNTNVERVTKNENNNEKKENEVKTLEPKRECARKIYKRIKHRSSLMDSMNLNSKDENTLNSNNIISKNDERINTDNEKVEIKKKINVNKRPYNNNKYINDLELYCSKHPRISLKKRINPQEIGKNIYNKNNTINVDENINANVSNEFKTERLMKERSNKNIFEDNNNNSNSNYIIDESNKINSSSNMVNKIYKISNNNIKAKNSLNFPSQENKRFKKNIEYSNNIDSNKFQNLNKSSSCFTNVIRNQYKEIKTYQKPKNSIDTSLSINQSQPHLNKVYEPKKCIKLRKAIDRFSPKNEQKYLNEQNYMRKDKIAYIKKNPSKKKEKFHHMNKSLGNLNSEINNINDYYTNKITNNRENTENINNGVEYSTRNNHYSKYTTENTIEETNFNSKYATIQEGINYHKFSRFNPAYYNTFYMRNHSETNNINNNINLYKINNIFNNTYGTFNSGQKNEVNTKVDSYRSRLKISKNNIFDTQNHNYKSTTNINKNSPLNLKYEDLLLLEDKLNNIIFSLNEERLISNECFDYWNLFFNCSLYENLEQILSSFDSDIKNLIKISLNYNLMSIIVSYNISFDQEVLNRIRPLLSEMLELCNKLLIMIFEYIKNISKINYNIWIKKINNLIQNLKSYDDSDTMLISSGQNKLSQKDKMNYNINFLMQKIYYILSNYPSNSSTQLINLFKKIKTKTYDEINNFFREYILREKGLKYSILATTFLRAGEVLPNKSAPYLTYRSPKKYTLVLDIDETLFHFRINEENDEQGVLKIRPGVFQFIDEIKEYYEIILFSEAERGYIDLLTEAIGENRYLYDCVLCRDYMSIVGKDFVKDLNKMGRSLDRVIIVDNMPQNFSLHKENAIYIKSFWGVENDDKALIDLIPILISIAKSGRDARKELVKYKEKIITKISSNIYKHSNL